MLKITVKLHNIVGFQLVHGVPHAFGVSHTQTFFFGFHHKMKPFILFLLLFHRVSRTVRAIPIYIQQIHLVVFDLGKHSCQSVNHFLRIYPFVVSRNDDDNPHSPILVLSRRI